MLERKNIRILDDVLDSFRQGQGKHVEKKGNEYNVTDLLGCRKKLEFKRANTPYKFVETDFSRQGKLGSLLHKVFQIELNKIGWITEQNEDPNATKFTKKIEKYTLHMRADGMKYIQSQNDGRTRLVLIELKFPMWNSTAKKGIPDY